MNKNLVRRSVDLDAEVDEALRRYVFEKRTTQRAALDKALRRFLKLPAVAS